MIVPAPAGYDPDEWAAYWLDAMLQTQQVIEKKKGRRRR